MCLFQVEGHAFPVLSKSYCWVARGTAVVDLLCVKPGPIACLIGRSRGLHRALEGAAPVALW